MGFKYAYGFVSIFMTDVEQMLFHVKKCEGEPRLTSEAVTWMCSVRKVFFKNSQNSPENTCAGVSF